MRPRLFAFFFAMLFLLPGAAHAAPLATSLEVSGWIPYWRAATGTADVLPHLSSLTAVQPFSYEVSPAGAIEDLMGITAPPWSALRAAAAAQHVRFVPTIAWSDSDAIESVLASSTARIALEDSIAALAVRNNFDGVDIDFENKPAEVRPYFSLFLKGLYQRMGPKWVYCSIESRTPVSERYDGTPPADATEYANDFAQINNYCDRVIIMAYDQGTIDLTLNKANPGPYAPIADLAWVRSVMQLAQQSISKKKLILGIPTYGYEYAVAPAQQGYTYNLLWSFDENYALQIAQAFNLTPRRTSGGELTFTYIPTSTPATAGVPNSANAAGPAAASVQPFNIMTWDDAAAVAQKVALAKQLGIRGVALFKFDGGEDQGIWNILDGK